MALHKRAGSAPPKMPFPGESPTVSLALAAGQMYGLNETEQAPKATPSKAGKKKKSAAKPSRKPSATRKPASKAKSKPKTR